MVDRRAVIIGSWLAKDKALSNQKIRAITKRWEKVFSNNYYGFKSINNENLKPKPIHNPTRATLTQLFENSIIHPETELLLFFLGHSTPYGTDDIELTLGENKAGEQIKIPFSHLLNIINYSPNKINRIVFILDTCHAGRMLDVFNNIEFDFLAMTASDWSYAFDASFSEGILRAFEEPLRRRDQRIDQRSGGVTYRKIFEYATKYVLSQNKKQLPNCYGNYVGELLLGAPKIVPDEYIESISKRSIYARVYRILEIIDRYRIRSYKELRTYIEADRIFLIKKDEEGGDQYISNKRIGEYINFLLKIQWIKNNNAAYQITESGSYALNREHFNEYLIQCIIEEILPNDFTFEILDTIIMGLLNDMIPPTPIKIQERAWMKGFRINLSPEIRVALQILPSTGRFLKGSADALFPFEF